MRGRLFGFSLGLGSRRSLAARGHFLNTFAGFGYGLALSLLALGAYLIGEQFENPVEAQSVGLLFAALLMATSRRCHASFRSDLKSAMLAARTNPNSSARSAKVRSAKLPPRT